ncbi:MAG: ring-cleaving dioxygenase [Vicinamibacterales bacterium]
MTSPILGLHHVTATVDDAQADLDFASGGLGLRLVKKTVNFDNHHVFHFYYGDERGRPGTLWTTFPYRGHGVRAGTHGAGQISTTSFSVPKGSLAWWRTHLAARGVTTYDAPARFGDAALECRDASGLVFELVESTGDPRAPWTASGVPTDAAVRGLYSVTMIVRSPVRTLELMTGLLGFAKVNEADHRIRVAVNGDAPGRLIDIVSDRDVPPGVNGLGTVHHVAMAVATGDEQRRLRDELLRLGAQVTDIRDRCYFESIYFREPGGVLFEVATVDPGFLIDEPLAGLGRHLKLPPWEEPNRAEIERGLPHVKLRT